MAIRRLQLARSGAGRKPENIDMDVLREMREEWGDDPMSVGGLSDGEEYATRQEAQKTAQGYKTYLENHFGTEETISGKKVTTFQGVKLSAITGPHPDNADAFAFSINPKSTSDETVEEAPATDEAPAENTA